MNHKLPFSGAIQKIAAKFSAALLLAALIVSTAALPVFAGSDEVLTTSGNTGDYYYECTYTPTREKKSSHSYDGYHSYYVDGYHVECQYTLVNPPKPHYPEP